MKIRLDGWAQQIAEECAPIIIAAPTARCGTTAIQRLLHTDPSVVVYGEDPTLVDMAVYMRHRIHGLQASRETAERVRRRIRANEWQARSTTDVDAYIQTCCHAVHLFARTFQSDAEAMGSTRWGQKVPSVPLSNAIAIRQFLPRTKVVYLVRDVGDCLRSIKAYRETRRRDPAEFCRLWVDNVRSWQAHREHCITVHFGRLERAPEAVTAELAEYLSLDLDPSVLTTRVNHAGGYRAPATLTDEELELGDAARAAVGGELCPTSTA